MEKKMKFHVRQFADEMYNLTYERWGLAAKTLQIQT